jgi:hypothetical protein
MWELEQEGQEIEETWDVMQGVYMGEIGETWCSVLHACWSKSAGIGETWHVIQGVPECWNKRAKGLVFSV